MFIDTNIKIIIEVMIREKAETNPSGNHTDCGGGSDIIRRRKTGSGRTGFFCRGRSWIFPPQACGQAQGTAELTIADRLFAHFLLPEESGVSADYQTQVESDWSYEAILAREAADENYVDAATGKSS